MKSFNSRFLFLAITVLLLGNSKLALSGTIMSDSDFSLGSPAHSGDVSLSGTSSNISLNFGNPQYSLGTPSYDISTTSWGFGSGMGALALDSTTSLGFGEGYNIFSNKNTSSDIFSLSNFSSMYSSNLFSSDYLMLKKSDVTCPGKCNPGVYNCGWGPITKERFDEYLDACGIKDKYTYGKPVFYRPDEEKISLQCAIGGVVTPVDTSLASISKLLQYDCGSLKDMGDGPYCHCVLKKSGQSGNNYYTPLSHGDLEALNQMVSLDRYQKEIRALRNSFSRVANILNAAVLEDPDLKALIEKDGMGKACLPGSFNQVEAFLTTPTGDDDKSVCGEKGMGGINRINLMNDIEDKCSGADQSNCPKEYLDIKGKIDFEKILNSARTLIIGPHEGVHEGAQNDSLRVSSDVNNAIAGAAGAIDTLLGNIVPKSFLVSVDEDGFESTKEAYGDGVALQIQNSGGNILQLREACSKINKEEQTSEQNAVCADVEISMPPTSYSYQTNIAKLLSDYRKGNYKNPDEFLQRMGDPQAIEHLMEEVGKSYRIIKLGVLENHADQGTPEAKLIELLDTLVDKSSSSAQSDSQAIMANQVVDGLKRIQRDLVVSATKSCNDFLEQTKKICRDIDKGDNNLSIEDYKSFRPEDALKFSTDKNALGALGSISSDALSRKLNQVRCAKIIDDPKLAALSLPNKEDEGSYKPSPGVLDMVTEGLVSSSTSEDVSVAEINPFTSSEDRVRRVASRSNNVGLGAMVSDLEKTSAVANIRGEKDLATNMGKFEDNASSMAAIGDFAKKTLDPGNNTASGNNSNSTFTNNTYSNAIKDYNDTELQKEKKTVEQNKVDAETRLDEIAARLADLMKSREETKKELEEKGKSLSEEEKKSDTDYTRLEMEKIALQKEIDKLNDQKQEKLKAKENFEKKLAEIDNTNRSKARGASAVSSLNSNNPNSGGKKSAGGSVGAAPSSGVKKISSVGSGGSGGASSASSSGGSSSETVQFNDSDFYVIKLSQEELSAAKQAYQVVENPNKWVPGGKPPALRIGNILYELEVKDGKIVYENGVPKTLKPLNVTQNIPGSNLFAPSTIKEQGDDKGRSPASRRARYSLDFLDQTMKEGINSSKK